MTATKKPSATTSQEIEVLPPATAEEERLLFDEAVGAEPSLFDAADFSQAASQRRPPVRKLSTNVGASDYLQEMAGYFEQLIEVLLQASTKLKDERAKPDRRWRVTAYNNHLMQDALDFIEEMLEVGDHDRRARIYDLAADLIETGFNIGRLVENGPANLKAAFYEQAAGFGSIGGKKGSKPRTERSLKWKDWIDKETERLRAANPSLSQEEIASKFETMTWPMQFGEPRARRTILDHIRFKDATSKIGSGSV